MSARQDRRAQPRRGKGSRRPRVHSDRARGGHTMSAAPMQVLTRPFAVEPVTNVMLPDGIFDNALYNLRVACHYTNISSASLTNVSLSRGKHRRSRNRIDRQDASLRVDTG